MRVRMAASAPPMVRAGSTRLANEPAPETGSHPSLIANSRIRIGPSAKLGNDRPKRLTTESRRSSQRLRRRAERTPAGIDSRIATNKRRQRESQRVGIALGDQLGDGLVVANRAAEIAVQHALPVVEVLLAQRSVEAVGVASGGDVGGRGAFAEHLRDGISGDEVNQQKDKAHYEPDDRQGVEDALEDSSVSSQVLSCRSSSGRWRRSGSPRVRETWPIRRVGILRLRATARLLATCFAQDDKFGPHSRHSISLRLPCASASPSDFAVFSILTLAMRWPSSSSTV